MAAWSLLCAFTTGDGGSDYKKIGLSVLWVVLGGGMQICLFKKILEE